MALLGTKLDKKVIMVVEKLEELRQIIAISRQFGVEPLIGIRARLLSRGAGKWAESAGENAKFGLSTAELLAATEMLKAENLSHCFKLLHFHIGSQVPDILIVKKAVQEAARFYAKLYKMGFQIEYLDVGGGLGVDYDGSRSAFDSSTNYTLQEYANDIVYYVADVCNAEKVPHPDIISESGRAIVAHHSVLIVEVFGAIEKVRPARMRRMQRERPAAGEGAARHPEEPAEAEQAGGLSRRAGAQGRRPAHVHAGHDGPAGEGQDREPVLGDQPRGGRELQGPGLCAGGDPQAGRQPGRPVPVQLLGLPVAARPLGAGPVVSRSCPISRLNERPTREATLVDITCDSDGQVNKFIDLRDVRDTLPLHPLNTNGNGQLEPYYLGFFLMGAYQDIMGDLHNLFGRVNEVHVFLEPDEPAGYYVEEIIEGSTIVQCLASVQYDENELKRQMKAQIDEAIKSDRMKPSEAMRLLDDYERGLKEYTYLSF